ncbi:MAG: hypothetical protein ACRCYY_08565 [Trueperaceae bacterium]
MIERGTWNPKGQRQRLTSLAFCFLLSTFYFLFSDFSSAQTQSCAEQLPGATSLSLKGVDITVYFINSTGGITTGPINFSDGVCIENSSGLQLLTVEASVYVVDDSPNIEAKNVKLSVEGYELSADALVSTPEGLELKGVMFSGENLSGRATRATYNFTTQEIALFDSSVRGQSVTIESKRAKLVGDEATFEELTVTTCRCAGDPFYLVRADNAGYNLTTQTLHVSAGTLELASSVRFAFADITLSPESLEDFRFPVTIEYIPGNVEDGGTGLGIRIPSLRLSDTLTVELGIVGLDEDYPTRGILVLRYKDTQANATLGFTTLGVQADLSGTKALSPWLSMTFGVNNRGWVGEDFLYESYMSTDARTSLPVFGGDAFEIHEQLLLAASSQTFYEEDNTPTYVRDGRLASNTTMRYQFPAFGLGQLELNTQARVGYYPLNQKVQWGVRLNPRWRAAFGPVSIDASYSRQWTNGTSPFSTNLDKLENEHQLFAVTQLAGPLNNTLQGEFRVVLDYDFLDVTRYVGEGFASLAASSKLIYSVNDIKVTPHLSIELAPLMNPDLDPNFRPLLSGGLTVAGSSWEAGFSVAHDLELGEFDKVQTSGSFTFDVGNISLKPFLALNVLPTLEANTWPLLDGYGLDLAWHTCCGTLHVGYRQLEDQFTTTLSVSLEESER